MKKRILMVSESSVLSSGYAIYTYELLKRLNEIEDFEIAELACFVDHDDHRLKHIPWKVYVNKPPENSPQYNIYKSEKSYEFGEFTFNDVCLDFQPTHVIDIRDFWMFAYQGHSPYRDHYNWLIMPTVDAHPQNKEWIDYFKCADGVLTYSEFGRTTLSKQCPSINLKGVASPAANSCFKPMDKRIIRDKFNIAEDAFIIGTVMRNQRRKLFPDLFRSFDRLLSESKSKNLYLYCHTGFPDVGWSIPELLIEYNLSDKVLFTYKCDNCQHIESCFFHDAIKQCKKCKTLSSKLSCTSFPIQDSELAEIYNIFDVYVQLANSEGFGMPVVEAASCGLPIIATYYSAMQSTIDNLDQFGVSIKHYTKEIETGCLRAAPEINELNSYLHTLMTDTVIYNDYKFRALDNKALYNWDRTAKVWENAIRSTNNKKLPWNSRPQIHEPSPLLDIPDPLNQANFLIIEVLGKPDWIGSFIWQRLVNDLTYKSRIGNMNQGFYFNEDYIKDHTFRQPFSFTDAYNECVGIRNYYNQCEMKRCQNYE